MFQLRRAAVFPLIATSILVGSFLIADKAIAQSTDPRAISMYNLGLKAYKDGSLDSAIIFFKRATDLDPNLADAQYNLGVLYQSQRRLKESASRFQEVLRVKPNDTDAQYQLGIISMGLGQYDEAKKYFSLIPPANVHFQDCQRKTAECEAKIASGVTTPTMPQTLPQGSEGPVRALPTNLAASNPPVQTNTAPPSYTSTQPTYTTQAATKIEQTQPAAQQPARQAVAYVPPQVTASGAGAKPTAVLANSSVRVIATGFHAPSGLTFDNQGNLYVANFNSNSVDRIGRDGTRSVFATGGHLKGPIGLVADESGNIYVANYSGGTVARITPAGISTIIATDFKKPYYLTLDRGGNLFVSQQEDNTIIRISLPQSLTAKPPSSVTP